MNTKHRISTQAVRVLAALVLAASTALATDITWTGAADTYWTNAANWDPPQVPTASNHVILNATNSGSVTVPASATFSSLDWMGGAIFGALTVATDATFNISSDASFLNAVLTNAGTVVWTSANMLHMSVPGVTNVVINNLASGLFDIRNDQLLTTIPVQKSFMNAGTVRKSAGLTSTINVGAFDNRGTVEAQTGTLSLVVRSNGYSSGPSAILAVSLGGTNTSDYGQIHITESNVTPVPLPLAGTFSVSTRSGFRPNPGDMFQVFSSYTPTTNDFACLDGLDLGGGLLLVPQFTATSLSLNAATYATNSSRPQLFITRSPTSAHLTWPLGFTNWVLQSATNLSSTNWSPVSAPCGNQALVPANPPEQYFRLISN